MTEYDCHYVNTLYGLLTLITHHMRKSLAISNFVNLLLPPSRLGKNKCKHNFLSIITYKLIKNNKLLSIWISKG